MRLVVLGCVNDGEELLCISNNVLSQCSDFASLCTSYYEKYKLCTRFIVLFILS